MPRLLTVVMLAAALSACRAGGVAAPATGLAQAQRAGRYDATSVLVRWKAGRQAAGRAAAAQLRLAPGRTLAAETEVLRLGAGQTVDGAVAALGRSGLAAACEPNWLVALPPAPAPGRMKSLAQALGAGTDPAGDVRQWGQAAIGMAQAWPLAKTLAPVTVAVLDTGCDLDHPDLRGALVPGASTYDEAGPDDYHGHGTHVAGVIAGRGLGDPGVHGVGPTLRVMPVKVLGPKGHDGKLENVVAGVYWAADHGARVINMSLGDAGTSAFLRDAVRYAQAKDVLVVAASGNATPEDPRTNLMNYPAALPGVIAVGAVDDQGAVADFSFWGTWLSLTAPGVDVFSSIPGGYEAESGTSMASPFVAGVAGLVRARWPQMTAVEVKARLEATARDLGDPGFDPHYGHGRLDAAKALGL